MSEYVIILSPSFLSSGECFYPSVKRGSRPALVSLPVYYHVIFNKSRLGTGFSGSFRRQLAIILFRLMKVNQGFAYIKHYMIYWQCYRLHTGNGKEVFIMDLALSFIVAVAAGVVCHYIIKWLDGDK